MLNRIIIFATEKINSLVKYIICNLLSNLNDMTEQFYETTKQIEIYLRGRMLQVSSITEALLSQILLVSRADEPDRKPYKFRTLTFDSKIKESENALSEKYLSIYDQNKTIFAELSKLKNIRNKIAHCKFDWLESEPEFVIIWDISEDETKLQFYTAEKHKIVDLINCIEKLKAIVLKLNEIITHLRVDFDQKFPGVLNLPN